MGVRSGTGGAVNGANTVRAWNITETSEIKEYRASNTVGGTGRKATIRDWSGSFTFYGATPSVMPGETFTFSGFPGSGSTNGVTGPAIVDSIEISWNQEDGSILEGTVNFSGNGAMSKATVSVTDSSVPNPPCSTSLVLNWGGSEFADVRSMSLTITANNKEYASSSTGGWKKRKAGSIDANGSFSFYHDDITAIPDAGDTEILKLYTTDSAFWEIKWAQVADDGVEVDIEGDELNGGSVNWNLNGFEGGVAGYIKKPDTNTFWPAA